MKHTLLTPLLSIGLTITAAFAQDSRVIDLSHTLGPDLPDFQPGKTQFVYQKVHSIATNGYASGKFTCPEHYGTHIDAPSHFVDGATSIDKLQAQDLVLPCVVIDVRKEAKDNPDYALTVAKIEAFEKQGQIPTGAAVLLLTGWSERWSEAKAYINQDSKGTMHFPAFSKESANFLLAKRKVRALGVDTISADIGASTTYDVHKIMLQQGKYLIENLNNLDKLKARGCTLICAPLPLKGGTGSPARIMALVK